MPTSLARAVAAVLVSVALAVGLTASSSLAEGRPRPRPSATPTPSPSLAPTAAPPPQFVSRVGATLAVDGAPFTFGGINVYNAASRDNCWYSLGRPDSALGAALDAAGVRTVRAWFFERLATTAGARDWAALDHVLAVARSRGVRVVATLANQWGDCEDDRYKDEAWYASGYRASYRAWAVAVASRYRDDPTVLAWQLMNEAEALQGGACSPTAEATVRAWAADVSAAVKAVDPRHLVSVGTMGSGQCGTSTGDSYERLAELPSVDLCEYHDYGHPTEALPGDAWNGLAARAAQCSARGRPTFVGEVGIAASDPARATEAAAKRAAASAVGVVGFMAWDWRSAGQSGGDEYVVGPGDPALAALR